MKYIVTLNGKEYEVVVEKDTAEVLSVQDPQSPTASMSK
jgi:hypothetical protein